MDNIRFLNLEYLFQTIYNIFLGTGDLGSGSFSGLNNFWVSSLPIIKFLSTIISLLLLTFAIYAYIRLKQVGVEAKSKYNNHYEPSAKDAPKNERWEKILVLLDSQNPSDWKQAIIGADVILDDIISKQGYHGETLGDKMKAIEPSDFNTLDHAWEAHKVRNRIAHGGGDFMLTEREAKRIISLYSAVFKEFGFI